MSFVSILPVDAEMLKCALCQNYLSVPPITMMSERGDNKCGRCHDIETQVNVRNKLLEEVFKLAKFPCIYKNCKEKLSWGDVEIHEQICPHKTYPCQFSRECSDIAIDDLETHYINEHQRLVSYEKLEIHLLCNMFFTFVLIKNKVIYLVYIDATKIHHCWISVFSLRSQPTKTIKFNVKLSTTTKSNITVQYEDETVTPYNEREHCAFCLFYECSLPHHKFSEKNKEKLQGESVLINYIQKINIDVPQIKTLLDSGELILKINIMDEPKTSVRDSSNFNNIKLVRQILQCPICLEFMRAEIYTCRIGHVICNTCAPRLEICPTCMNKIAGSRNYALEEIAENFELACRYQKQGCNFIGNAANIYEHQARCSYEVPNPIGKDCIGYLESICTADIQGLKNSAAVLTVFTNENGGILDDLIITKISEDHLYVVSNAARKQHDQQHLLKALEYHRKRNPSTDIKIKFFEPKERGLLALQGPKAQEALKNITDVDLSSLYFMNSTTGTVAGIQGCRITRCGYTGEDGFEISTPASGVVKLARELTNDGNVKLAGLGARDSLRLEAGLCLYGNDITTETTPVEAALTWLVAKRRREQKNFPGADTILKQIKEGSSVKRVGLVSKAGPPARHDASILSEDGQELGKITSGCPSPSLGGNIAMGYVPTSYSKAGTKVNLKIRDKVYEAVVSKMPFVKANYYNKPK